MLIGVNVKTVSFIVLWLRALLFGFGIYAGTVLHCFVLCQIEQCAQDPFLFFFNTLFFFLPAVQTQSPVLQGKMLVPMATVRAAPAPSQQFPLVAPPLPVQNGAQAGSKV